MSVTKAMTFVFVGRNSVRLSLEGLIHLQTAICPEPGALLGWGGHAVQV